jgi:phage gp29-like protein
MSRKQIRSAKNYNVTSMTYSSAIQGINNPASVISSSQPIPNQVKQNLNNYISPVQLTRLKHDVGMWRDAVAEAEYAYYPQRVKMQRMYLDTSLNGHVESCWNKRKNLTLLRRYEILDINGKTLDDVKIALQKCEWFTNFISYTLDAIAYGYSLIAIGDIENNDLPNLSLIRRWNVSPDRYNVTSSLYATTGQDFRADEVKDWHIYIPTPSKTGTSPCGYGLFYNVAIYEIFCRNLLGYNGDFVERFSMPYVHAKTTKPSDERDELEATVSNMGANGYAITDPQDEIEFLEAALGGTGWNGYDNLEKRCEDKISKLILGHSDALDSTPGKLGADQGGDESPVQKALSEIQISDGRMIERVINQQLFPKLCNLGLIPKGFQFVFLNDDEVQESTERNNLNAQMLANVGVAMKNAGLTISPNYFTEKTGIPATAIVESTPIIKDNYKQLPENIKNKLNKLYKIKA